MISSISSFEIISVVLDPKYVFWIATSVTDSADFNLKGIKTLLATDVSTYFSLMVKELLLMEQEVE